MSAGEFQRSVLVDDDDLPITDTLVRRLLRRDAPALADRPLRRLDIAGSSNAGRLRDVRAEIDDWLARCSEVPGLDLDLTAAARYWASTAGLPEPDVAPTWVHADLLAENLLVRGPAPADRTLAGVLDLGGLAVGRPAVGLVGAWELFGPADREVLRRTVGVGDDEWQVARAWAFAIAMMTFPYYWHTMPVRCRHRLVAARAVLDEASLPAA